MGKAEFLDRFRSFPSRHCTSTSPFPLLLLREHLRLYTNSKIEVTFAGLVYLSLFLAAKLSLTLPFLTPKSQSSVAYKSRKAAAAPPLYLLVIISIPICAAIYIASTLFTDGKHAGFDVLFGSLECLLCAWFAFRYYHPIRKGAGRAWGPRHENVAFRSRMGLKSYRAGYNACKGKEMRMDDMERGNVGMELQNMGSIGGSYESQRGLV